MVRDGFPGEQTSANDVLGFKYRSVVIYCGGAPSLARQRRLLFLFLFKVPFCLEWGFGAGIELNETAVVRK